MKLEEYLTQLLYHNDCVIIPNFGGFITHYKPASINFIENQIDPPSKTLSFNQKLTTNDGLLVNYIAQKEHISYKAASERLSFFSEKLERELLEKSFIYLFGIGKLHFNEENKIEFTPEKNNFLLESYGFKTIECYPILRSKEYLNKKSATKTVLQKNYLSGLAKISRKHLSQAAIIILFVVAVPFLWNTVLKRFLNAGPSHASMVNLEEQQNQNNEKNNTENRTTNTASFLDSMDRVLPSRNTEKPMEQADTATYVNELTTTTNTPTIIPENITSLTTSTQKSEPTPEYEPTDIAVEQKKDQPIKAEETPKTKPAKTYDYIIVLGSFGNVSNASRLTIKLEEAGYLPDLTETGNGLYRVGAQINCTKSEIKTHLSKLRKKFNKKAWVMKL